MSQIRPGQIKSTGTPSSSTYLRGDGSWSTPAGASGASLFVQDTDPGMTDPGLWIDTSGGNVTFWFEDGL